VREGRAVADARVAHGLYDRAIGNHHTLERTALPAILPVVFSSSRDPLYRCERIILPDASALTVARSVAKRDWAEEQRV
jgi:hypothetical protein